MSLSISSGTFNLVLEQLYAARTELALFFLAFALHHALFGNSLPRVLKGWSKTSAAQSKATRKGFKSKSDRSSDGNPDTRAVGYEPLDVENMDVIQALECSTSAYNRSDHRTVLRCWNQLKRSHDIPASHLARVVESLQRFKKDSTTILEEVHGFLGANIGMCDIVYINELLEPLAESLDSEVVNGIVNYMPTLGIKPDKTTYELLIKMHFATRNLDQVSDLCKQMRTDNIVPSTPTSLVFLKTALSTSNLDEAVRCFGEVTSANKGQPTASSAPKHIAQQLVELARRMHRTEAVLAELETERMPLTADALNSLLAEAISANDHSFTTRIERLSKMAGAECNGRTFQLLVKLAGNNTTRIAHLLDEMATNKVDATHDTCASVLQACAASGSTELADKLYSIMSTRQTKSTSALKAFIRFYTEYGMPEKACNIYEQHLVITRGGDAQDGAAQEKRSDALDARTGRSLILAALKCGRQHLAKDVLAGAASDTALHVSLIRSCAVQGSLQDAMSLFHALQVSGAQMTNSIYNSTLDACVECHDLDAAQKLMNMMVVEGYADAVSYNTMIKAHLCHDNFTSVRQVMEDMRKAGHTPNHVTYNELINALVRSPRQGRHMQVWDIVEEMKQTGVQPNAVTCSILLKNLTSKSPQQDILKTMEITDTLADSIDEVLLSSVVEACVRVGRPALLSKKLEELRGKNKIAVSGAHTFGSLIKAYGHAKDVAGAWRCWKEMHSQHVKPTSITIGCMVEAVVSNGDVDGGYELMMQLLDDPQSKDQVNAVVFGSVLKGYGRTRHMERVWSVFQAMLSHGIEPSIVTFNAVIDACARNSRMDAVPELLSDMRKRNLEPNVITYSTVIKGYCACADLPAALAILDELHNNPHLKADEIVYNTLLDGCAQSGVAAEGERLFKQMQREGITPSNYTVTVLVKLMGQSRRLDRAFEIIEEVSQKYHLKPNNHVYNALIMACLNFRDTSQAVWAFEQMAIQRMTLDPRTAQSLIRAVMATGNVQQVDMLIRTMMGISGSQAHFVSVQLQDSFLQEMIHSLAGRDPEGASLAYKLQQDIYSVRSKLKMHT